MGADRALAILTETTGGVALRRDASPLDFRVRAWYDPPGELLLGKIVPNLLTAYGQMTKALLVARFIFDVPIRGSLTLLYALSLLFMLGTRTCCRSPRSAPSCSRWLSCASGSS